MKPLSSRRSIKYDNISHYVSVIVTRTKRRSAFLIKRVAFVEDTFSKLINL